MLKIPILGEPYVFMSVNEFAFLLALVAVISAITGMAYYVTAEQQRKKREKRHELIPEKYRDLI